VEWNGAQVSGAIADHVDVLVGNEEDLQKGLGSRSGCALEVQAGYERVPRMIEQVVAKHPNVKVVATTLREVHSTNHHSWSALRGSTGKRSTRRRRS